MFTTFQKIYRIQQYRSCRDYFAHQCCQFFAHFFKYSKYLLYREESVTFLPFFINKDNSNPLSFAASTTHLLSLLSVCFIYLIYTWYIYYYVTLFQDFTPAHFQLESNLQSTTGSITAPINTSFSASHSEKLLYDVYTNFPLQYVMLFSFLFAYFYFLVWQLMQRQRI